jgi:hypothetical protein
MTTVPVSLVTGDLESIAIGMVTRSRRLSPEGPSVAQLRASHF